MTTTAASTTLLNPFSISLNKPPYMEVNTLPCYEIGEFKVYKRSNDYYIHTFKNIVIGERCGINKELLNNLHTDTIPEGKSNSYFNYHRAKEAMLQGIEEAKKLNFPIK